MNATEQQIKDRVMAALGDGEYDGWVLKELYNDGHGYHCTFGHPSDNSGLYGDGATPNEALAHALGKITT